MTINIYNHVHLHLILVMHYKQLFVVEVCQIMTKSRLLEGTQRDNNLLLCYTANNLMLLWPNICAWEWTQPGNVLLIWS